MKHHHGRTLRRKYLGRTFAVTNNGVLRLFPAETPASRDKIDALVTAAQIANALHRLTGLDPTPEYDALDKAIVEGVG